MKFDVFGSTHLCELVAPWDPGKPDQKSVLNDQITQPGIDRLC